MYGETFYGRHTAQHQLQWIQIKISLPRNIVIRLTEHAQHDLKAQKQMSCFWKPYWPYFFWAYCKFFWPSFWEFFLYL